MSIVTIQGGLLYLSICLFSIYLVMINAQYSLNLLNNVGLTITLFWLLCLFILQFSGINKASSTLYFGFFAVLGLFHLGIPLVMALNYEGGYFIKYFNRWFFSDYTLEALYTVYIFLIGYLFSFFYRPTFKFKVKSLKLLAIHLKFFFYTFLFIVSAWIIVVRFLYNIDNYTVYQESNQIPILNFSFVYLNQIIGFFLVVLCTSKKYAKKALFIFFIWAIVAFPLGLRGEVIFPLVISLPLLVTNNVIKVTYTKAAIGILIALTLSSLVFIYRGDDSSNKDIDVNPLATVAELGGSLRPVYEVTKWIDTYQIDYLYGATYYAPFERAFLKILPIKERLPATEDMRLMNVAISERAGPYGFSIIAESKINFGWFGAFFIGIVSGIIMKLVDRKLYLKQFDLWGLCLIFALFFHIRQSFVGAFGVFIISFVFSIGIILITNKMRRVA